MNKKLFKCYFSYPPSNPQFMLEYIWARSIEDAKRIYKNMKLISKETSSLMIEEIEHRITSRNLKYVDFTNIDNPEDIKHIPRYYCKNCGKAIIDLYQRWCDSCDSEIIG